MSPRRIETAPLWGVSRFLVGDQAVTWELSQAEIQADVAAARRFLQALGVRAGDRVLFLAKLPEAPYFWPLELALLAQGGQLSSADATPFDAYRSAMFLRTLSFRAVIGIDAAVLDGLEAQGADPVALLSPVPSVLARPDAVARLEAAGLRPLRMCFLGPALALEAWPGAGPAVDPELWELASEGGEVLVTSRIARAMRFERQRTGVRAAIERAGGRCVLRGAISAANA